MLGQPWIRFQIPSERTGEDYARWLGDLLGSFLRSTDPTNHGLHKVVVNEYCCSIRQFRVQDSDVGYWKAYMPDWRDRGVDDPWRGLVLHDHSEMSHRIPQLVIVQAAFEDFLKSKGIAYAVYGRLDSQSQNETMVSSYTP